jgi:predicted nucleic acid-binding protein
MIYIDDIIEQRARLFVEAGIKPLDALHLASAEAAEVEYLCTCDDRSLRKARQRRDISSYFTLLNRGSERGIGDCRESP